MVIGMGQVMNFHPEWGWLAPTPRFTRTMRAVLVATAVGAVAGGGVVLSLDVHAERGQMSVSQRTLVGTLPATPTPINVSRTGLTKTTHPASENDWASQSQLNNPPTKELNASPPPRLPAVTASAGVRVASDGASAKIAPVPTPTNRIRPKRLSQKTQNTVPVSSSPAPRRSLASRTESNVFQRVWAGLAAAVEHVWSISTLPTSRTSRAHGADAFSAAT